MSKKDKARDIDRETITHGYHRTIKWMNVRGFHGREYLQQFRGLSTKQRY